MQNLASRQNLVFDIVFTLFSFFFISLNDNVNCENLCLNFVRLNKIYNIYIVII